MASRIVGEYPGCFLGEHPPRICKGKKAFGDIIYGFESLLEGFQQHS